jgi:flagellar biosynthesis anti-sigma factor FlgM
MNVSNNLENLTQIFESQTPATTAKSGVSATIQKENIQNEGVLSQSVVQPNSDRAQVSATAAQVAQSATAPDVRLDKVAAIQSALQAGTYTVPASAVAQKVISSLLTTDK